MLRGQVQQIWVKGVGMKDLELLDHLLDTAGVVEPRIAEVVGALRSPSSSLVAPRDLSWLTSDVPGWLQDVIRLSYGRAYAQRRLFDEALESLSGLELSQVCDPCFASFLPSYVRTSSDEENDCLDNVKLLMQRETELPTRYRQVATLMQADIAPLKKTH